MSANKPKLRAALALVGFLVVTFCAPLLGAFTLPGDWYAALTKPTWNPPAWIFGPAWTLLYTLMSVAAWLVWTRGGLKAQRRPLTLYFVQLALNAAWTPIVFGAHSLGWGVLTIGLLWIAILLTLMMFRRVSAVAGVLLVPYLAWVTFATALNFELWRMNRT